MSAWDNQAGPRRVKPIRDLLHAISDETRTCVEISPNGDRFTYMHLFGATRSDLYEKTEAVRTRFGGVLTVGNLPEVKAALEAILAEAIETRPVVDKRKPAAEPAAV